jgi:capsular exopolysaccharide synthesis family protein
MDARSSIAPSAPAGSQPSLQWRRQVALFRRRLPLFLGVALGGFALAAAVIFSIPARYTAVADVMIDLRRERVLELSQVLPDITADAGVVDTEVEVLKSRALAEKVVERLGLEADPEFNPAAFSRPWGWRPAPPHLPATDVLTRAAVVARVEKRLKIARAGFTYVIAISFSDPSGEKAARIANAVAELYLGQQLEAKSQAAHRASDWLGARLGGLRAQVEAAEHAVERYKAAHGLMTLPDSEGATITEQEISNLDAQMASARGERAETEARLSAAEAQIARGGQGDDVGEVLNSPVVQDLRKQRDDAAKQIAELQARYGPRHPELLKATRRLSEIDTQIRQEIARVVSGLKVQAQVARGRSAAIASSLAAAKAALARSNGASVELKELQRNLEAVRTLYQSFLDRSKQTSAQDGMAQADARLISAAQAPMAPAFPNRPLLLLVALAASIVAGLLAIWAAEAHEDGFYAAEDVERRLDVASLAMIPAVVSVGKRPADAPPIDLVFQQPLSAFAEAFRAVKAGLLLNRRAGPIRTVVVASALPGEGKTTTCLCLGRIMAQGGAAVVVVDCDVRRRTLNRLVVKPPGAGLLEVLDGSVELDDALVQDAVTGLQLLPLGESPVVDDVLETAAMDRLLDGLRRRFRVVILDTAPVLMVAETQGLAAKADAVLFLARWRRTPAEAAASAVKLLHAAGAYVAGAVLTQVDPRHAGGGPYGYAADYYPFYRADIGRRTER